jgi:hypothetical protein
MAEQQPVEAGPADRDRTDHKIVLHQEPFGRNPDT